MTAFFLLASQWILPRVRGLRSVERATAMEMFQSSRLRRFCQTDRRSLAKYSAVKVRSRASGVFDRRSIIPAVRAADWSATCSVLDRGSPQRKTNGRKNNRGPGEYCNRMGVFYQTSVHTDTINLSYLVLT